MSFWTKRRKIQARLDSYLSDIARENLQAEGMAGNSTSVLDSNDSDDEHQSSSQQQLDVDGSKEGESSSVGLENDEYVFMNESDEQYSDSSDSFSQEEFDYEHEPDNNLREALQKWAIRNNIAHVAVADLLAILRNYHIDLPKDPRTLLSVVKSTGIRDIQGGAYYHFGIRDNIHSSLTRDAQLRLFDTIELQINVDGLPLFKSSSAQFWPILGRLPQAINNDLFAIGIFYGQSKPSDPSEFLHDFMQEARELQKNGILYENQNYQFTISNFVCDTPARAYVKGTKGHNGYSGCDKCIQHGEYLNSRMTFPETGASLRTDVSFDEMVDDDHHVRPCPLKDLQIGMVTKFPLDYMHLVCLGIMKRILLLWMKGPLHCRLGGQIKDCISNSLISLSGYIPREFARKPRSLSDLERWKATEFRLFLLYTGPVVLKDKIAKEMYENFMLLSVSIHILISPVLHKKFCNYAKKPADTFRGAFL